MDVERLFREVDFFQNPEHKAALWKTLTLKRLQMEQAIRQTETEDDVLTETELEAIAAGKGTIALPSPEKRNKKNI